MAGRLAWLIYKDLLSESRARCAWPTMLLLGLVVVLLIGLQMGRGAGPRSGMAAGLFWLAVVLTATPALEQSFASERENRCWDGLMLYPVPPALVYTAKLLTNFLMLAVLEAVLLLAFAVFCGVSLLQRPGGLFVVAGLANLGIAALGTLLAAASSRARNGGAMVRLVALPALVPVLLAGAESMSALRDGNLGADGWRWVQLLGAFAVVFTTAGLILFGFLIED